MIRNETPLVLIAGYSDFGVYAYDVQDVQNRMILGHDVQERELLAESVRDVLEATRVRLFAHFGLEDDE
jgi:hypothetical protein